MWLSRKLTQHEKQNTASAETGEVTIDSGEVAVFSSGEDRDVRIAAPGGFFWRPISGEKVLVIKGGAEILLHNDGRVDINGELFINGMPYIPLLM